MNIGLDSIKQSIINSSKFYTDLVSDITYGTKNVHISAGTVLKADVCTAPVRQYIAKPASFAELAQVGAGLLAGDLITKRVYCDQKDKRLLSLQGGLVTVITTQIGTAITNSKLAGLAIGIGAGVTTSIVKEMIESKGKGQINKDDIIATAIGSATMGVALLF